MRLTVHIGTTKTGSTSIQAFMRANRAALLQKGICYPRSLGAQDHRKATLSSLELNQSRDLMGRAQIDTEAKLEVLRVRTKAKYRRELRVNLKHVVISSEHLQSRLVQTKNVARFRQQFCQDFDDVKIVVYIRPQLDQIVSFYSTLLRSGYSKSLSEFIKSRIRPGFLPYFNIRAMINRWSEQFGNENVIVRPYKAIEGPLGTLGDFCDLLEIDPASAEWAEIKKSNTSLNVAGQELLLMLNQAGALSDVQRRQIVHWVTTNCAGKGAIPSLSLAKAFQAQFDEGNAWVVKKYFPDHPEYLEPSWPRE